MAELKIVGRSERRVDGVKLATGRAHFADDITLPGLLHAHILRSPHAHARIVSIDASQARAMPGVAFVLTHEDVPRVAHAAGGDDSPRDAFMLDAKVRCVGDRVSVVAAEDLELAIKASAAIEVEYAILPAVDDPALALSSGAPLVHDEADALGIREATRNLAASLESGAGDLAQGFAEADRVFEATYKTPPIRAAAIEPNVTLTWLDEDDRLVVRTASESSFRVRRMLAALLGIPLGRIRVQQLQMGGMLGGTRDILTADLCAVLTLRSGRPVRLESSRGEVPQARHGQIVTIKSGVRKGRFTALDVRVLENIGAYAVNPIEALRATEQALSLYPCPNFRYQADAVYTNSSSGACDGFFALESHVDEVASAMGDDPLEFRRRNQEADDPSTKRIELSSCGLPQAIQMGAKAIGWGRRRRKPASEGAVKRGMGMALVVHAPGSCEAGAASITMNEAGSFHLLAGASGGCRGIDTLSCQIAAETLGVSLESIIFTRSDTDVTPFHTSGSATTLIACEAVEKAARKVLTQILGVGGHLLGEDPTLLAAREGRVWAKGGRSVSYAEVHLASLESEPRFPIAGLGSAGHGDLPPAFAAVFAEVEVDTETGIVRVTKIVEAVDCGQVINPLIAQGEIEGGTVQALGYALGGPMTAIDVHEIVTILVPTVEPSGPFGAKALSGIPFLGPPPAVANAVCHALGLRIREIPLTPDRVLSAIRGASG
jgi:putative selenate reductase molybdopterin-binding subunit